MTDHEYIERLIIKYLSEEASLDERIELKCFLENDEEVRKQFVEIRDVWNISNSNEFDSTNAFAQFKQRVTSEQNQRNRRTISWLKYAGVAASLIIILAIGKYISTVNTPAIKYYTYETQPGERKLAILPDSTKVWLNGNSQLSYSSNFNKAERTVSFEGEAFFDVIHNSNVPFKVKSGVHTITVLGTRFNVKATERIVETVLQEGKVQINVDTNDQQFLLNPGQKSEFDIYNNRLIKMDEPAVEIYEAITNGQLVFKNERLSKLAPRLETWFGVNLILNDDVKHLRFTGTIEKESIEDVLNIMAMSNNIKYTQSNDTITITPN